MYRVVLFWPKEFSRHQEELKYPLDYENSNTIAAKIILISIFS